MSVIGDALSLSSGLSRSRLVRSGSSDSLFLSGKSGSARHHHAVPSRKPRAEQPFPVPCPSALSSERPRSHACQLRSLKLRARPETARLAKESRSQKHTRVKIRSRLSVCTEETADLIRFRCLSKSLSVKWSGLQFTLNKTAEFPGGLW